MASALPQGPVMALLAIFGLLFWWVGSRDVRRMDGGQRLASFLVAGRQVGLWSGALSAAATWIWAPALFVAAQKAYMQGLPGLFWFTVPNVGALVLFAFLARRIRHLHPHGLTLPQFMGERFGDRVHLIYFTAFLLLQVSSLAVQLLAGADLLAMTVGISRPLGVALLVVLFTSYSLVGGLRASIRTDVLQMLFILAGVLLLPGLAWWVAGDGDIFQRGLSGVDGRHASLFDGEVAYAFGITVTIGLLSGPAGDQQHWQRAHAFAPGMALRGYLLAAVFFALVPLGMGSLGFLAAGNPLLAPQVAAGALAAQQVGPEVVRTVLPSWAVWFFLLMILSGLASTGDSALCAAGSLLTVDLYQRYFSPEASPEHQLRVARRMLLAVALLSSLIAMIPGITILGLFLFYGTVRSATLMPTLLTLFAKRLPSAAGLFWGVALAILLGLPLYLAGVFLDNVHLRVAANVGVLLLSLFIPILFGLPSQRHGQS